MHGLLYLVSFASFAGTESNEVNRETMVVPDNWRL